MFEAAEAVMRPEMVMGEWRHGSGGLEAVMPGGDVWWVSLLHGFAGKRSLHLQLSWCAAD